MIYRVKIVANKTRYAHLPLLCIKQKEFRRFFLISDAKVILPVQAISIKQLEALPLLFKLLVILIKGMVVECAFYVSQVGCARRNEPTLDKGYVNEDMLSSEIITRETHERWRRLAPRVETRLEAGKVA